MRQWVLAFISIDIYYRVVKVKILVDCIENNNDVIILIQLLDNRHDQH